MRHTKHASAFALLTTFAAAACTTGVPSGTPGTDPVETQAEAPIAPANLSPLTPAKGRPRFILSAGRRSPVANIATLMEADAGGPTVSTDSSYAYGAPITITFGNMPGNSKDWVGFARQGAPAYEYAWYAYTDTTTSGTVTMPTGDFLPPGTWVARAFYGNGYVIKAESAAFTVGAMSPAPGNTVNTDKSSYHGLETVHVTYTGLSGAGAVTVGAFPTYGSTGLPYALASAAEGASGSADLGELLTGTYEIRVFTGTDWKLTSSTFTVTPKVETNKTQYVVGESIAVTFGGPQGLSFNDSVAIAVQGSASTEKLSSQNLDWYWAGTHSFSSSLLTPGTNYVARMFFDFSTDVKAESAPFTVVAP